MGLIFHYELLYGIVDSPVLLNLILIEVLPRSLRCINLFNVSNHKTDYALNLSLSSILKTYNYIHKLSFDVDIFDQSLHDFLSTVKLLALE